MREKRVKEIIKTFAKKGHFELKKEGKANKADLLFVHQTWPAYRYYIEAKGSKNNKWDGNMRKSVSTAIGQVIRCMDDDKINIGVALPHNKIYIKEIKKISKYARKLLKLDFFFVKNNKDVYVLNPSSNEIIKKSHLTQKFGRYKK